MNPTLPIRTFRVDRLPVAVYGSNRELGQAAAWDARAILAQAIAANGVANLILATGNSQLTFLHALRTLDGIDWARVNVFHMDEYVGIDPDHPASFPRFLREQIIDIVHPAAFYPVPSQPDDLAQACREYEALLRSHPADLVALGWGENGHLAFNDPPYAKFDDPDWVKVVKLELSSRRQQVGEGHFATLEDVPTDAITLTIPALLASKRILAIVPEARKAAAVAACLSEPVSEERPGSILRRVEHAQLYLDIDSAARFAQQKEKLMSDRPKIHLPEERYFDPDPQQKAIALELYRQVKDLPLICPHGHVDPRVFADPDYSFGTPTDLLIIPDHYVFRMLYSQGVPLEQLGIAARDGTAVESDHRRAWQIFGENFHLFRGTPTGMWLNHELHSVFGVEQKLNAASAQEIYDQITAKLATPEFRPRRLYERFNIEVLTTTDPATSTLEHHQAIRDSGWQGRILPTFRPDAVINLDAAGWRDNIDLLSAVSGIEARDYARYIQALEQRRSHFKDMGATATDHAALTPYTELLPQREAAMIYQRALRGRTRPDDARRFTAHMLMEMARMSVEDGLVMQLHTGSLRSHNQKLYDRFGPDMGADIPVATEFTRNLQPLLNRFGNEPNFTLVLFMLDESTLSRELAPLAGHYPALRLGPPWWFFDSWNGMMRFRQYVTETAGLYNTAGFNDDTRAYASIPARHDLARRVDANWIANLVVRSVVDMEDAEEMIRAAAYDLAKRTYRLG